MLQAIAGYDANDPTSLSDPAPDMLAGIEDGVEGVRIGLDERHVSDGVDPELAQAVLDGVKVLEGLGAKIVEIQMPDVDKYLPAWPVLCFVRGGGGAPRELSVAPRRLRPLVPGLAGHGRGESRARTTRRPTICAPSATASCERRSEILT